MAYSVQSKNLQQTWQHSLLCASLGMNGHRRMAALLMSALLGYEEMVNTFWGRKGHEQAGPLDGLIRGLQSFPVRVAKRTQAIAVGKSWRIIKLNCLQWPRCH